MARIAGPGSLPDQAVDGEHLFLGVAGVEHVQAQGLVQEIFFELFGFLAMDDKWREQDRDQQKFFHVFLRT